MAVCRTAPATQGLLNIKEKEKIIRRTEEGDWVGTKEGLWGTRGKTGAVGGVVVGVGEEAGAYYQYLPINIQN